MFANTIKLKSSQFLLISSRRNISTSPKLFLDNIFSVKSEKEFNKKVLESQEPVLVGFFDEKCNKCKMQIPKSAMIANEFKDKLLMAEVYINHAKEIAEKFNIDLKIIPTHAFVKNGQIKGQLTGIQEMEAIRKFVLLNFNDSTK